MLIPVCVRQQFLGGDSVDPVEEVDRLVYVRRDEPGDGHCRPPAPGDSFIDLSPVGGSGSRSALRFGLGDLSLLVVLGGLAVVVTSIDPQLFRSLAEVIVIKHGYM
ncbi:hypothetical protein GCM10010205_80110 [Streptomyces nojiriensis]|nr:hypothetical protein GCM10010205_80110 [Streptomyces nojiriensis]